MLTSFEIEFSWETYFKVTKNVIAQKEQAEVEFKETFHSPKSNTKNFTNGLPALQMQAAD